MQQTPTVDSEESVAFAEGRGDRRANLDRHTVNDDAIVVF
jgi:hypothetical protein